jgi:predicted nucleic acid-binding protein
MLIKAFAKIATPRGLQLFASHNVDVVDAIVHATAKQKDWDVFSFDQDMKKFS